jgi:hypothetical protein
MGLLGGIIGSWLWYNYRIASCPIGERLSETSGCVRSIMSSGETPRLFLGRTNVDLEEGIINFQKGEYKKAKERFEQAKYVDPSDPVPYIYSNNAKARLQSQLEGKPPWKLAVVVGIDSFEDTAREILRGVADSQDKFNSPDEFNKTVGKDGRLLEIVIANDGNQPEFSRKVADELVNHQDILGIIGHHASESSEKALPIYEKRNFAMLSPTSSSSELEGKVFFRPIQSTKEAAKIYVNYIKNTDKLRIFYDNRLYSQSLAKDFLEVFIEKTKKQKKINKNSSQSVQELCRSAKITCDDFSDTFFNIKDVLNKAKKDEVIFLMPSLDLTSWGLAFARINNKDYKDEHIKILVAMSLSEPPIGAQKTDFSFDGLLFARPCVNEESPYVMRAKKKWQQDNISWRTTASYDATQTFVKAIRSRSPQTRKGMLDALKFIRLSKEESSGFELEWSPNQSNELRPYCMYKVDQGQFKKVEVNEK